MTMQSDSQESATYSVLAFDICSSTDILEDLLRTGSARRWRDLHIALKDWLLAQRSSVHFQVYQFTGDGWILLFQQPVNGKHLMSFVKDLCLKFDQLYAQKIKPVIETTPAVIGLTMGMDRGRLIKVLMNSRDEFIGRPLNVACRLQSAIKDKDKNPEYKILMSKHLYESIKAELKPNAFSEVKRTLRNIAGGRVVSCMKAVILRTESNLQKRVPSGQKFPKPEAGNPKSKR